MSGKRPEDYKHGEILLHDADSGLRIKRAYGRYELEELIETTSLPGALVPSTHWRLIMSTMDVDDAFDLMTQRAEAKEKRKFTAKDKGAAPPLTLRACLDRAWERAQRAVLSEFVVDE